MHINISVKVLSYHNTINAPKKRIKQQKGIAGVQISWNRASGQESDVGLKIERRAQQVSG